MRKSIAVLALAGAFGTLFADNGPEVANWFTAIGDSPSFEHLNPVNGAWTITPGTDGSAGYADGRLVLELGADGSAVFAATDGTAPDTNTITRVTITTTFEPLTELPDSSDADGDANLVVCGGKFYVWDGGKWVDTDITAPAAGVETEILAEITYQGVNAARAIRFTIGEGNDAVRTDWITLVSAENAFANVTIKGATTLDNIIGQIEMGRAENNGIKYSTIADAKSAAKSGSDKTITLLRNSTEDVVVDSEIEIETAGMKTGWISLDPEDKNAKIQIAYGKTPSESTKSGEVKLYVSTTEPVEKINIKVNDDSKEVFQPEWSEYGQIKFHLRTSTEVLNCVKPDGIKPLKTDPTNPNDDYRKFLSFVAKDVYEEAHADPARIQEAIVEAAPNGVPLWQNYVMGVTDYKKPLQPVAAPAGDKDNGFITLSVPVINKEDETGDYKVTYEVANDDGSVTKTVDDPQAIKVPLGTGTYKIQAILSEPEK